MRRSRLVPLVAGALLLLALPGTSSAGSSTCGTEILTTAAQSSVSNWYSPGCYKQAAKLVTPDMSAYSDIGSVISTAARRDLLRPLRIAVAKKAPGGKVKITFSPTVGSIRVSVFVRKGGKGGRFVVAAIGTLRGAGGTLKSKKVGKGARIRVSAGYVGSGDTPRTITLTLAR
jgi:hypothetical protein